jgi:hypothetical protein
MKIAVALAALVLSLSACSGDDEPAAVAQDPNDSSPSAPNARVGTDMPSEAPVPAGQVRTANVITVMDTGEPQLCLGPIAESYPPQCSGPAITNWDWDTFGQDMYDEEGDIRWGTYVLTGTWDGTSFEVTEAIPGALYDPAVPEPTPTPTPAVDYSDFALEDIATQLSDGLPGVLGAYGGEGTDGHVLVDVTYDDGSLQEWADGYYGAGVVIITSALVDAG